MFAAGYALSNNISRTIICHPYHQLFYQSLPLLQHFFLPLFGTMLSHYLLEPYCAAAKEPFALPLE